MQYIVLACNFYCSNESTLNMRQSSGLVGRIDGLVQALRSPTRDQPNWLILPESSWLMSKCLFIVRSLLPCLR